MYVVEINVLNVVLNNLGNSISGKDVNDVLRSSRRFNSITSRVNKTVIGFYYSPGSVSSRLSVSFKYFWINDHLITVSRSIKGNVAKLAFTGCASRGNRDNRLTFTVSKTINKVKLGVAIFINWDISTTVIW